MITQGSCKNIMNNLVFFMDQSVGFLVYSWLLIYICILLVSRLLNLIFWWWNHLICVYVLICVLSDIGCFDQDETIKAGKSCWAGGTCQKIGRQAGGSIDISTKGFGPWIWASGQEERILNQGYQSCGGQLADWAIGRKRGRCAEESDEAL